MVVAVPPTLIIKGNEEQVRSIKSLQGCPAVVLSSHGVTHGTGELVVLHTVTGGAQPVAAAIDSESWPDVLGTIAGDDTVLVIGRDPAGGAALAQRFLDLANDPHHISAKDNL